MACKPNLPVEIGPICYPQNYEFFEGKNILLSKGVHSEVSPDQSEVGVTKVLIE
jgi:hypothetical protein